MGPGVTTPGTSPPAHEGPLTPSEQPVIDDGQLGGDAIERQGSERANPEGSMGISDEELQR